MTTGITINAHFEPREILLAGITFPGTSVTKLRPILVISKFSSVTRGQSQHFICLPITSNDSKDQFMLKIKDEDVKGKPLKKPSQVICNYIFTILKGDVRKKIGAVTPDFYQRIMRIVNQQIL